MFSALQAAFHPSQMVDHQALQISNPAPHQAL